MINRRSLLGCVAVGLVTTGFTTSANAVPIHRNVTLLLGDTPVVLRVLFNGRGPRFFHPHENEHASLRVAEDAVVRRGGMSVSLHHGGGRRISFELGGKKYSCDPNRIFTPEGTRLTTGNAPQRVRDAVDVFAAAVAGYVLKRLSVHDVVIGMHNNTPGGYSIRSYGSGGDMQEDAETIFTNEANSADDFFLTTKRQLFQDLKNHHYNVVLQKNPPQHNDGSFSVFCSQKNIPYVNIEAQDAHSVVQARMLNDLLGILSSAAA